MTATGADRVREVFMRHVRREVGSRPTDVALLLGAGVDGATVGLAAHHLGHRVHAYTFQLGPHRSHDSKWAERTCQKMGWPWTCVVLPTHVRHVVEQWSRMYRELHCRKKREFECTWPFLWTYPRVRERIVLSGLHAGAFFGLGRRAYKLGASGPTGDRKAFDDLRREIAWPLQHHGDRILSPQYNPSCMLQHDMLLREFDLVGVNPFRSPEAYRLFLDYDWMQLNHPTQKQFLRHSFEDHQVIGVRNHQGYQKAGGICSHFEKVLDTPVNYRGRKRTLDMFGDYWHAGKEQDVERVLRQIENARLRGGSS